MRKKATTSHQQARTKTPLSSRTLHFGWHTPLAGIIGAGVLLLSLSSATADDSKSALKSIRQDIAKTEQRVSQQKIQRSKLLSQLQGQEKKIAEASRKLRQTQIALSATNNAITKLNASVKHLQQQQTKQESLLAAQLETAFRQGKNSGLQFILNNEESQRSERIMAYFGYLNESRQKTIADLQQTRRSLSTQKAALLAQQTQQKSLAAQQQQQQQQLRQAQTARQSTLSQLESTLQKDQAELVEMRKNERRLQDKIARAEREAKARSAREAREAERVRQRQAQAKAKGSTYQPTESEQALISRTGGLGRPRGQVLWPVHGPVIHAFGETMQGELRWKGMVIKAPEGAEVHAIADGRVLMADWLQGYGLVVVVEHGHGDMSLYGYNQSALVSVGARVKAGQAIALVGTSGGQGTPSLYFEIRRQGRAVNPQPWLGK